MVTDARAPVEVGQAIELSVNPRRLHGFDAGTGGALGAPTVPQAAPAPVGIT